MDPTKTADDIKPGTMFKFVKGQRLERYDDPKGEFTYVHRSLFGVPGEYDDFVMTFVGIKRIDESKFPMSAGSIATRPSKRGLGKTRRRRVTSQRRRNVMRRKPAFIARGKVIFIESWDMIYPYPDQGNIYIDED